MTSDKEGLIGRLAELRGILASGAKLQTSSRRYCAEWLDEAASAIQAQAREIEGLKQAAGALVEGLDAALPAMDAICVSAAVHGFRYTGPDLSPHIEALRSRLSHPSPTGGGG